MAVSQHIEPSGYRVAFPILLPHTALYLAGYGRSLEPEQSPHMGCYGPPERIFCAEQRRFASKLGSTWWQSISGMRPRAERKRSRRVNVLCRIWFLRQAQWLVHSNEEPPHRGYRKPQRPLDVIILKSVNKEGWLYTSPNTVLTWYVPVRPRRKIRSFVVQTL